MRRYSGIILSWTLRGHESGTSKRIFAYWNRSARRRRFHVPGIYLHAIPFACGQLAHRIMPFLGRFIYTYIFSSLPESREREGGYSKDVLMLVHVEAYNQVSEETPPYLV